MQLSGVDSFKVGLALAESKISTTLVDIPRSPTHAAMLKAIYPKGIRQRHFLPSLPGNS